MDQAAPDQTFRSPAAKAPIAAGFRAWRVFHNLTRAEVGALVGANMHTITAWEHARSTPPAAAVAILDAAYPGLVRSLFPNALPLALQA